MRTIETKTVIVEIKCLASGIDPSQRGKRYRVAFAAESVVSVREVPVIGGTHTKIAFRGDTYEHHAVETDVEYDAIMQLIGWSLEGKR